MPDIALIIIGLALLLAGGTWIVRGGSDLALLFGVSPLIIGLTVVAFGTSAPELATSALSAYHGRGDIALGNVVGSNVLNIGLVLGLTALFRPVRVNDPANTKFVLFLLAVSVLLFVLSYPLVISRVSGFILLAFLALFIWFTVRSARSGEDALPELPTGQVPGKTGARAGVLSDNRMLVKKVFLVIGGLVLLLGGGELLVRGAVTFAARLGLSEAAVGVTVVAVGTSLPELVVSVLAAIRKVSGLALGNIIGSNIFNIVAILGVSASLFPFTVSPVMTNVSIPVMLVFTAVLVCYCLTRWTISRAGGAILVLSTVLYGTFLIYFS